MKNIYERREEAIGRKGQGREEREKEKENDGEERGKSACPQGYEAITKLQKLTIKPDRHTGATIKLAGRPADRRIFLAFTTNHVATWRTENVERYTRSLPSRECNPRGWILPAQRKENCTAILQRHSKCRCKTSTLLPSSSPLPPPPSSPASFSSPYPHFFLHHSSYLPGNPFALRV